VREPHRGVQKRFRADRLSCHRFLANAFRLLLHGSAYNLVNLFRLQLPQPWRYGPDRNAARSTVQNPGFAVRQTARCVRFSPRQRLALPELVALCRLRRQQPVERTALSELTFLQNVPAEACPKLSAATRTLLARMLSPCHPLIAQSLPNPPTVSPKQNLSPHELKQASGWLFGISSDKTWPRGSASVETIFSWRKMVI